MPFEPINFANIKPQGNPLFRDLLDNLMQGYQLGQVPAQLQRQKQKEELANAMQKLLVEEQPQKFGEESQGRQLSNALQKLKVQEEPQRFGSEMSTASIGRALDQARINQLAEEAKLPFGGKIPSGSIGQAFYLDMIGKKYGENSPVYANAKRAFEADLSKSEELTDYRKVLAGTLNKRSATPLTKMALEMLDIQEGYMPGTNRTKQITPEMQKNLSNELALKIQKESSDTSARNKALYASNIDKTLKQINVEDLTQYAGLKGGLTRKFEEGLAPVGKESQNYRNYQKSLINAQLLAKQIRQFYGDSIQPAMIERIEHMTNPAVWLNNPTIAKQNFESLKNTLQKETATYRGALKSTKEYEEPESESGEWHYNPKTGKLEK